MNKINVFIVDDHEIFRKGLKLVLNEIEFITIAGEAENGQVFLDILDCTPIDIVLMDIRMPVLNGIDATKLALEKYPNLCIIALSLFDETEYVKQMLDAGAKGFLLKNVKRDELKKALLTISDGISNYFSTSLSSIIINEYLDSTKIIEKECKEKIKNKFNITCKGQQILEMICNGYTTESISKQLNLSPRTIEGHRHRLLQKIGATNTASLIKLAIKYQLINI